MTSARQVNQMVAAVGAANRWRESLSPLRHLSMPRAVSLMEEAQQGIMADLQWLYGCETGIEATDSDLMVICERSLAALLDCEWGVEQVSDETRAFDPVLAEEQESFLRGQYEGCRNLYAALAHLAMHRFRGYAHVNPVYAPGGGLRELAVLDQWNLVRDGYAGPWYWNPEARQCLARALPAGSRLDPREYVVCTTRRPVNRIGLIKYVRATTAEKDWDSYVETYGLPGVFVIMPQQIPAGRESEYQDAAEEAAKGGSGALPAGSDVKVPGESTRGSQPFAPRLEWLQKQLVLAGTGGMLTMLAESGSGTLAGSVHEQAFRQLGRALARTISEALQQQLDLPWLERQFPGRPVLAYFNVSARQERDVAKIADTFAKLATAGFQVDPEQASQETGYTLTLRPQAPAMPQPGALLTARKPGTPAVVAAADANARLTEAAAGLYEDALRRGYKPLAKRLLAALEAPDEASMRTLLEKLQADLPALAKDLISDPAGAEALEAAMGAALANGIEAAAIAKGTEA
jgi:phage gp29-like protein